MERAGYDPDAIGPDPERLARIGAFVELHVEQGRALDLTGDRGRRRLRDLAARPLAVRLPRRGQPRGHHPARGPPRPDADLRRDRARRPRARPGSPAPLATFGKIAVEPNGVNAIPSLVRGWLDSRAADQDTLDAVVAGDREGGPRARRRATASTSTSSASPSRPSWSSHHALRDELARILRGGRGPVPVLGTGAGHDAGILSASRPDRHAVRTQPHRRLALPGRVRRRGRLRGRGRSHSPTYWKGWRAADTREHADRRTGWSTPGSTRTSSRASSSDVAGRPDHRRPHRASTPRRRAPTSLRGLTLPGLANAHSHAFHRALRGTVQVGSGTFWTWRETMYRVAARLTPDTYHALARAVYAEMALAGITASASSTTSTTRPAARPTTTPTRWARR